MLFIHGDGYAAERVFGKPHVPSGEDVSHKEGILHSIDACVASTEDTEELLKFHDLAT